MRPDLGAPSPDMQPTTTAPASPAFLRVENLSIGFAGVSVNVVDGISFAIPAGKTLCLVGESGCGKSVTSLAIMGLLPPKSTRIPTGSAVFDGLELLHLSRAELEAIRGDRMAMIFQEPMTSLNPSFSVGDQVAEAVRRYARRYREPTQNPDRVVLILTPDKVMSSGYMAR